MENEISESRGKALNLLIISFDIIGKQMAGPGIRFYEFARILSNFADVILAAPNKIDIETDGFKTFAYNFNNYRGLKRVSERADIILIQGHILHYFPFLKNFKGKIIVDLYNPFNLESLEMFTDAQMAERLRIDKNNLDLIKFQCAIGDYFICASEKQRSYWLGMLCAMGRINPYNYDDDATFKKLIDVVPFGIPSTPAKHTGESIKKSFPGIREDDHIILWGGGIWNWLDPITAVKAIWEITRSRKDIKLIFSGVKHPDPKLPEMRKAIEAIKLSKELDIFDKFVFFNEWVQYDMRQNFLLESSVGLSLHLEKIETEFAYRTRVLDYIWAKLPIVTTQGDSIASMVSRENIGEVVKYENTSQLARIIESIVSNHSLRDIYIKNLEKLLPRFYWENVTKPLAEYCLNPGYARDKKNIMNMINLQNNKIMDVLRSHFKGVTNIMVLTSNIHNDREMFSGGDLGKVYYLEVENEFEQAHQDGINTDEVGFLKSKIIGRTKFDGIIANNAFKNLSPKFFYDFLNVISMRLRAEGILFFSMPEQRGLSGMLGGKDYYDRTGSRIDEFTIEYMLKNSGFEVIDRGIWDKVEMLESEKSDDNLPAIDSIKGLEEFAGENLYSRNELTDLFEIKLSKKDFKELNLLKGLNILDSEEFANDKSIKGKIKKYIYAVTSLYLENLRKSYNSSMQAVNNNIQVQINNEINQLNAKNRERMIFIYYNVIKTLLFQVSNLQIDLRALRKIIEGESGKYENELNAIDERLEVILGDTENIDRIMGLTFSNRYFVAKKL